MSLSYGEYANRITNELNLLGSFESDVKSAIIKDALTAFCRFVEPEISATLAVSTAVLSYSVPASIEKIVAFRDENSQNVVYTLDDSRRVVTLQDAPSGSVNFTVYGTPRDVRTNCNTIIDGLNENYGDSLWQYIVWAAHQQTQSDRAMEMYQIARNVAKELRQDRNRYPDAYSQALQWRDSKGNIIDELYNADNIAPNLSGWLGSDL